MEKAPCLIIINGKPCTGKSYFLNKLCKDLGLSYVSRDELKELLFDELGIVDSEWSQKLGKTSYSLLFNVFEKLLKSKKSFIVESNFNPIHHSEKLRELLNRYGFNVVEIFLDADPKVLFERYKDRWNSGERHRGHADNERFAEFEMRLKDNVFPLKLSEKLIQIDTSDFNSIDYDSLKNNLIKLM